MIKSTTRGLHAENALAEAESHSCYQPQGNVVFRRKTPQDGFRPRARALPRGGRGGGGVTKGERAGEGPFEITPLPLPPEGTRKVALRLFARGDGTSPHT